MKYKKNNPFAFAPHAKPLNLGYCAESGKVCFDKRGAVSSMNARWEEDHERLRIYPCPYCHYWHLTSRLQ